VAASPVDTHSELATVLLRLGEAVWGDARAAATEATRAFGSNYPNAQDYAAEREAVAGAIEGGQRKAWGLRGRLMELAAYVREGGAVPAWWTEYSGGAGGSSVAEQGQWSVGGRGKGKGKGKGTDVAKGKGKEKEKEKEKEVGKGKGKRRAS
jgi:hypothetical protein